MKKLVLVSCIWLSVSLFSACSVKEANLEMKTKSSTTITEKISTDPEIIESSETSETTVKETSSTVTSIECPLGPSVELGTIYYQDLDESEPIQGNAKYLGCYIVDDGETVNLIPLMAATVQNLNLYTSGQGNEEYYQQFMDKAVETSLLTGGKPVNIFDREDGNVIITAENGEMTFSL